MAVNIMVWTFMTHQGTTLLKNEKNFKIQTGRRYLEIQRRLQIKRMDISAVLIERSQQTPQQHTPSHKERRPLMQYLNCYSMYFHLASDQEWPAYILMVEILGAQQLREMLYQQYRVYALTKMVTQHGSYAAVKYKRLLGM